MIQSLENRFMAITWFLTYFIFKGRATTKYWLHKTSKAYYGMNRVDSLGIMIYKTAPMESVSTFLWDILDPRSSINNKNLSFSKKLWEHFPWNSLQL